MSSSVVGCDLTYSGVCILYVCVVSLCRSDPAAHAGRSASEEEEAWGESLSCLCVLPGWGWARGRVRVKNGGWGSNPVRQSRSGGEWPVLLAEADADTGQTCPPPLLRSG